MGGPRSVRFGIRFAGLAALAGCCALLASAAGCGGGRAVAEPEAEKQDAKADLRDKAKAKPKADFSQMRVNLVPGDPQDPLRTVKPGHWTGATLDAQANNFDFKGSLWVRANDREGQPLSVEGTPFYLAIDRPAVLPKGQKKQLEVTLFVPRTQSRPWVLSQLHDDARGIELKREQEQLQPMPPYQYDLVVLARQPERYSYLASAEAVRPVSDDINMAEDGFLYRIVAPRLGTRAPLPAQPLLWTRIAYVLWDDAAPQIFDHDQEQALLDWIHWGGHLIVSGPQSLDGLRGSFLEPYLPVRSDGPRELAAADLQELSDHWSTVKSKRSGSGPLQEGKPWLGVHWQLQPGADAVPRTGGLVAERRLGRGRIVVSAFPLTQRQLIDWRGYDAVLNACLLRRGPRKFFPADDGGRRTTWATHGNFCWDPREVTHVRYFARDTGYSGKSQPPLPDPSDAPFTGGTPASGILDEGARDGGAAAWNDFGPVPQAVRKSLREGAGIVIPKPSFVMWVLGLYLVVLVPLNWSVFRLLGRVEWAWAAAPLVSLSCAGLVIWLAQLDIGFARSSTELTIAEFQPGYPRAHLSRYTALYASLSTGYDLHYDAPSAVAQPFASVAGFQMLQGQARHRVLFRRDDGLTLSGLEVSSNSTSMVHGEAMWDVGGALAWNEPAEGPPELTNGTPLKLEGVGLVCRVLKDETWITQRAWIGELRPGAVLQPHFSPIGDVRQSTGPAGEQGLDLDELVRLAEAPANLEPGEVRLIGWCLTDVPGLDIRPASVSRRHATLVVAHLARHDDMVPRSDVWLTADTPRVRGLALPPDDSVPGDESPPVR